LKGATVNQTNVTITQSSTAKQVVTTNPKIKPDTSEELRNWLQDELRLAAAYWQKQIHPFIIGRKLRYAEFEVARSAYCRVQETIENGRQWNTGNWPLGAGKCNGGDGEKFPIPANKFPALDKFQKPAPLLVDKSLQPETLAAIAAPMIGKQLPKLLPSQAVQVAHDLLTAAQDYLVTLRESQTRGHRERLVTGESTVSFDEIAQSNRGDSGQLPLLPPSPSKRKGRTEQEISEKPLSKAAIKQAVLGFLHNHQAAKTAVDDCSRTHRISLKDLCAMRYERFKKFATDQQKRAIGREAKKKATKIETSKEKLPKSAATSPLVVGKRQK
jgi:hypothetical protein